MGISAISWTRMSVAGKAADVDEAALWKAVVEVVLEEVAEASLAFLSLELARLYCNHTYKKKQTMN